MNRIIVMREKDFVNYVVHREQEAQIEVLKRIKPFGNATKINRIIQAIKKGEFNSTTLLGNRKKNQGPKEVNVKFVNLGDAGEFANIKQYLVRD